ncbi:TVP38/TMEM64 family protein [Streptomyces sp. GSL17-111]|uniref:TVP38/TMEM64 family protein n=1 Tax=Streptomyces sp. GSL17-111 TaxID=3121596 RepID=UPI0030F49864
MPAPTSSVPPPPPLAERAEPVVRDGPRPGRGRLLRLGLLTVLLAAGLYAATTLFDPRLLTEPGWAGHLPTALAVPAFVALHGVGSAVFVPRPVLTVAAGVLFGAATGTAAALAGTVLGAGLAFGLGRLLGQDALRPLLRGRRLAAGDRLLSRYGFRAVLVLRLLPGVPFAASNYAASVSRMSWTAILAGTAVGALPSTVAYALVGSRAADPTSPEFLAASAFLGVMGIAAVVLTRFRRGRPDERGYEPVGAAV